MTQLYSSCKPIRTFLLIPLPNLRWRPCQDENAAFGGGNPTVARSNKNDPVSAGLTNMFPSTAVLMVTTLTTSLQHIMTNIARRPSMASQNNWTHFLFDLFLATICVWNVVGREEKFGVSCHIHRYALSNGADKLEHSLATEHRAFIISRILVKQDIRNIKNSYR